MAEIYDFNNKLKQRTDTRTSSIQDKPLSPRAKAALQEMASLLRGNPELADRTARWLSGELPGQVALAENQSYFGIVGLLEDIPSKYEFVSNTKRDQMIDSEKIYGRFEHLVPQYQKMIICRTAVDNEKRVLEGFVGIYGLPK